jgi:O-antigen/teichoic acid export membrane protein
MALRLAAIAVGATYGVTETMVAVVLAQVAATACVGVAGWAAFSRFPRVEQAPLAGDSPGIRSFVFQSSLATGVVSLRTTLAPLLLGIVSTVPQVGAFRAALAPQQGFHSLSAPARMILLTEQTRDWERGNRAAVFSSVRRYTLAAAALTAVITIPLVIFMPSLIRLLYGNKFSGAGDAARIIAVAGALQLVYGWTKSFPISIGRPGLRTLGYALEAVVLIPLVVVLGREWGATGGAGAILGATVASTILWTVLLVRLRREHRSASVAPPPLPREVLP